MQSYHDEDLHALVTEKGWDMQNLTFPKRIPALACRYYIIAQVAIIRLVLPLRISSGKQGEGFSKVPKQHHGCKRVQDKRCK